MFEYMMNHRKVGILLLVIGIIEVAICILAIFTKEPSSFLLMGVVAIVCGVFLIAGGTRYGEKITFVMTFFAGYIVSSVIFMAIERPVGLLLVEFKIHTADFILSTIPPIINALLFVYICIGLNKANNRDNKDKKKRNHLIKASMLGFGIVVISWFGTYLYTHDSKSEKAIAMAKAKYGQNYKYYLKGFSSRDGGLAAKIVIYDQKSIKNVTIDVK